MDHGSILLKEGCLHGYQTELAGQMKDLKDRFKKIEDDTYWSSLEEEVVCLVIQNIAEKLAEWEESLEKREEIISGQRAILDVQFQEHPEIDLLKNDVFWSVLHQLECVSLELLVLRASF